MRFTFGDDWDKSAGDAQQFNEDYNDNYSVDFIDSYENISKSVLSPTLFVQETDKHNDSIDLNTDQPSHNISHDFMLMEELNHWAEDWQSILTEICRMLPDDAKSIRPELHQELVDLANQTQFAAHDLARALLLLMQNGLLTGRFGKIILEYTYEWVLPQEKQGVRDLYEYLSWQISQQKLMNANTVAETVKEEK